MTMSRTWSRAFGDRSQHDMPLGVLGAMKRARERTLAGIHRRQLKRARPARPHRRRSIRVDTRIFVSPLVFDRVHFDKSGFPRKIVVVDVHAEHLAHLCDSKGCDRMAESFVVNTDRVSGARGKTGSKLLDQLRRRFLPRCGRDFLHFGNKLSGPPQIDVLIESGIRTFHVDSLRRTSLDHISIVNAQKESQRQRRHSFAATTVKCRCPLIKRVLCACQEHTIIGRCSGRAHIGRSEQ